MSALNMSKSDLKNMEQCDTVEKKRWTVWNKREKEMSASSHGQSRLCTQHLRTKMVSLIDVVLKECFRPP